MSNDSWRKFAATNYSLTFDNRISKGISKGIIGHVHDFTSHLPYGGVARSSVICGFKRTTGRYHNKRLQYYIPRYRPTFSIEMT